MGKDNINIVTAPEHRYFPNDSLKIFLAGGICKCIEWQKMVVNYFTSWDYQEPSQNVYLLNPRRTDWIEEPGAAERQIEWEFDMIERCDVFTIYFAGGESDQPICMYELGRNIERMKQKFPESWTERILITCDSNYKRFKDVITQVRLATNGEIEVQVINGEKESVESHIDQIYHIIQNMKKRWY